MQIDDKAVALDIYNITRGKVRFPAEKDGYVRPGKDGAFICMRIADEFDLSEGDTLKISPYGSDKTYKLKVAGIIRSVSENIVISSDYAKSLDIPFKTDSVYTDTKRPMSSRRNVYPPFSRSRLLLIRSIHLWT